MSTNSKALKPGTILKGNKTYRIERVLGAGGFGITYLATFSFKVENLEVRAQVAIKEHYLRAQCDRGNDGCTVVCPGTEDSRAMTASSLKDFVSEAKRLSQYGASHPNIVKVNEIIEANGTAYYVMEFLQGQSLNDYIYEHGPLNENEIKELVYPIIDATAYLHRQKVTHLDIKPGNIMLAQNEDGSLRPVLIDFGLSKHYNSDGTATSTVNTMACSEGYAPMEQYSGIDTFSPAADVYALGATLYHATSGKLPIKSSSWPSGEPAATIDTLPVSETLRRVITRAMSDRAADRYPDAGAMLADLGVSSAASAGTHTVRVKKTKSKNDTVPIAVAAPSPAPAAQQPVISSETGVSVKSNKYLTCAVLIAAIAVVLILAIGGYLMFRNPGTQAEPVEDAHELIAVAEVEEEVIPEETVLQTSIYNDAVAAYDSRNYTRAKELFQSISSDANAQFYLGLMYEMGYGVSQDYSEAVRWYSLSAKQGNASAQTNLGAMYENGQGVNQSNSEALRWYRLAANQGDTQAQCNLGYMYFNGSGVTQDYSEALRWYRLAANQGNTQAQCNLGYMYNNGYGVPQDRQEAIRLYRLSAAQGNQIAKDNLRALGVSE